MAEDNFKWKEVSSKEKKNIEKYAMSLMKDFSKELEKIKIKEEHFEFNSGMREEGDPWKTDEEFRDLMLLNAPLVEEDSIVAEKGSWKDD